MDILIIGADHRPIGLFHALCSFGITLLLAAALIWFMLHSFAGDRMLHPRVRLACAAFSAIAWGIIQHWRGSNGIGSAILGIEAGLVTLVMGIAYVRLVRHLRSST